MYVRTDTLSLYIHRNGWLWVAQKKFTMNDMDKYIHTTNAAGYAPGEDKFLRRGRRMALLDFAKQFEAKRWPKFWELLKRNVANVILSYAHHEDCKRGLYQRPDQNRCGRFMNLYAVDAIHNKDMTRLKVMEINNNPGVHAYNTLDVKTANDKEKHAMYHDIYGDMMQMLGFNTYDETFTPRSLSDEWDSRLGFDMAFPPPDGDFAAAGYGESPTVKALSEEAHAEYRELYQHIQDQVNWVPRGHGQFSSNGVQDTWPELRTLGEIPSQTPPPAAKPIPEKSPKADDVPSGCPKESLQSPLRARIPASSEKCGVQLWVDVDNVLADSGPRYERFGTANSARYASQDPLMPFSNVVLNEFFWRNCAVNIITARGDWENAEAMTHTWLEEHGFLFHSLLVVRSAKDKLPILRKKCTSTLPCIFVDDLRHGWHLKPYGKKTGLYTDLVEAYAKEPHITLELFGRWDCIKAKYLNGRQLSPILMRAAVLHSGTLKVLEHHIDTYNGALRSKLNFDVLMFVKQNPKFEKKTLYEQLGVQISHKSTLPWASMLQRIPLPQGKMVNSIPGVVEMFGTKGTMYKHARSAFSLQTFHLPDEIAQFKQHRSEAKFGYKPDHESNGAGAVWVRG